MAHVEVDNRGLTAPTDSTLAFYDANAENYVEATRANDLSTFYSELLSRIPPDGLVLDAGCGSGRDVVAFLERGFRVEAFDASAALARLASEWSGVDVEVQRFEDWAAPIERYDGIWCFASLLHVERRNLPEVLRKLRQALKPGGWLFASFKRGSSDIVDEWGRRFTNFTESSASRLFAAAAEFEVVRSWEQSGPSGLGDPTTWVYIVARRPEQS